MKRFLLITALAAQAGGQTRLSPIQIATPAGGGENTAQRPWRGREVMAVLPNESCGEWTLPPVLEARATIVPKAVAKAFLHKATAAPKLNATFVGPTTLEVCTDKAYTGLIIVEWQAPLKSKGVTK